MSCKWNGRENPRVVIDRHDAGCDSGSCKGCQPCVEPHCRVCGIAHGLGACPECLGAARDDLRTIGVLCDALPEEVMHRGIDGEAMTLLGPACDPEARGHLEASVLAGRVSADYLDDAGGEHHPKFVVSSWDLVWRDALEHDEADAWTLMVGIDYLDRQMTYMATFEHVPFEDFARDVRGCVAHLESVLHDGEQVDTGAPCLNDGVRLVREWGKLAASDGWRCPKCKTFSDESQYRLAVKAEHMTQAEWLTASDLAEWLADEADVVSGVVPATPGTIRAWASKRKVRKRRDAGRTMYLKADVLKMATASEAA